MLLWDKQCTSVHMLAHSMLAQVVQNITKIPHVISPPKEIHPKNAVPEPPKTTVNRNVNKMYSDF